MKYGKSSIYAIVVLYNSNFKDSETLTKLLGDEEINIIVCDNSTSDFQNHDLSKKKNVIYINMNGNKGLAKAYNSAISNIPSEKLVVLLDDDSILPNNFFEKVLNEIDDSDIYLPLVVDDTGILSPCKIKKGSYFRYKDSNEFDHDFSAINSGLVIKSDIYKHYKYDENLFLDYIDHDFIRSMKINNKKFKLLKNICIKQNFSQNIDDKISATIRLGILKKDLRYFYKNQIGRYYWTIFKKKVHLCLIHKSLIFLVK